MRPDEHKKKKNEAYKKKHGITKDTSDRKDGKTKKEKEKTTGDSSKHLKNEPSTKSVHANNSAKTSSSSLSSSSKTSHSHYLHRREGAVGTSKVQTEESSSSESSTSDEELETSNRKKPFKSFRKRQIVSNWQKYELPPEEEKLSARGENYEKLLSMAGETISHFRFKDELDWDDQADSANENCSDTYSQFLCVNSAEIAQSLTCLPVHQILGISQNVFPDEQLSSMMSMVKDRRSAYNAEVLKQKGLIINSSDKDVPIETIHDSRLQIEQDPEDDQPVILSALRLRIKDHVGIVPNTCKQKIINSQAAPDASVKAQDCQGDYSRTDFAAEEVLGSDRSKIILKKPDEELHLQDDDLDAVLAFDNSAADVAAGINEPSQKEPTIGSSVSKNDANSLLVQTSTANSDSKLVAESSDLEAWLDSILDD